MPTSISERGRKRANAGGTGSDGSAGAFGCGEAIPQIADNHSVIGESESGDQSVIDDEMELDEDAADADA
jgi:hypothetical protein